MYRALFVFLISLGNIIILQSYSLAFFLFSLMLFSLIFFPYRLYIRSLKHLILIPMIAVLISFFALLFIENLIHKEPSRMGYQLLHATSKHKPRFICSACHPCAKKALPKKASIHSHSSSFIQQIASTYKHYMRYVFGLFIGSMIHFQYLKLVYIVLLIVYCVFLCSTSNYVETSAYSVLSLLLVSYFLPIFNRFISHNIIHLYLFHCILLFAIFLLGLFRVERFRV